MAEMEAFVAVVVVSAGVAGNPGSKPRKRSGEITKKLTFSE